jgi:6-pyruvoyltetrahydropterin/6-carboxytetrahydropterin synthase
MAMELAYRFGFDAAHYFEHFPAGHPNQGVHGHSFQAEVAVHGKPDPRTGFAVDFHELEQACAELRAALDHRVLNEVEGLEKPSLENLCAWMWGRLAPRFPSLARVTVRRDSSGQSCTYTGSEPRTARS